MLHLCCAAGVGADGLVLSGWDVVGCDRKPCPENPRRVIESCARKVDLGGFDAAYLSVPRDDGRLKLVEAIRKRLIRAGIPWVIESEHPEDLGPFRLALCGAMFGLRVYRHRFYESSHMLFGQTHPRHRRPCKRPGVLQTDPFLSVTGNFGPVEAGKKAMGVTRDITRVELVRATPPAYLKYIGTQLMQVHQAEAHR
jgi:DNA (cytosine-5)-methyltransferase 1